MKNTRKIFALLLCITLLIPAAMLASCGKSGGAIVMSESSTGKNLNVNANIYNYYLSFTKTNILYTAQQNGSQIADTADFWAQPYTSETNPEIATVSDYIKYNTIDTVKQILAVRAYCESNKLTLTDDDIKEVDTAMSTLIETHYNKSKFQLNSILSQFSINDTMLKEIKKYERMYTKVIDHLFAEGTGTSIVSDDEVNQKFADYIRVSHILISNESAELDENGQPIPYTEAELAERKTKAEDIYNKIINGETTFEDQISQSEDSGISSYPNGYFITKDENFVQSFKDAAFDMKVGDVRLVESEYGWHIMKKYEPETEETADEVTQIKTSIRNDIQYDVMTTALQPYMDSITVDEDEINQYDVTSAANMLNCLQILE